MERKILFKAKKLSDGQWVKGYYYEECGNTYIIENRQEKSMLNRNHPHQVDPSTVCQFTGLKDREGNDIFEGDLLAEDKIAVFEVGYTKCGFACSYLFHKHFMYDLYKISKTHVVCGSKFDRKEEK